MTTHVQTQPSMISLTAGTAPAVQARDVAAQAGPPAGIRGAFARFGRRFMSALIASRAAHALAEIESYDWRLAADLRAAMERGEHPFD